MRGITLVNAVREDIAKYPNLCELTIHLYDDEDQEHLGEDAEFVEDLFANNASERTRFIKALEDLEKNTDLFLFIRVKITEDHVILFYKNSRAVIFSRQEHPGAFDSGN